MQNLSKISSLGLLLFLFALNGYPQSINLKADLMLVDSLAKQQTHQPQKRKYIFENQSKNFKNSNPVSLIYGGSLYVYQNFVSQHFSADCLYDPSCSDFSKQAVKEYGLIKGALLSIDRLSRCNRIAATGLDPGMINEKSHRYNDPIKSYR
jgi:putative membrane protein insertion efficiency factor